MCYIINIKHMLILTFEQEAYLFIANEQYTFVYMHNINMCFKITSKEIRVYQVIENF